MAQLKEILPKTGMVFYELQLNPILCKPKLLPLKSVTLDKLEKMQRDAQEKLTEMEQLANEEEQKRRLGSQSENAAKTAEGAEEQPVTATSGAADVWSADAAESEAGDDNSQAN